MKEAMRDKTVGGSTGSGLQVQPRPSAESLDVFAKLILSGAMEPTLFYGPAPLAWMPPEGLDWVQQVVDKGPEQWLLIRNY